MRIIAIINQKGGCGKTTTAINLAGVLAKMSKRTLLVDLDPQSHCAAGLAIPEQRIDVQIGDAMLARPEQTIDWTRLLWRVSRHLDLAPSTVRLAALESARGGLATAEGSETRLAGVLSRLADQYDVCVIDCPPNIGLLTYNALAAATEVIIPVETAFFALQGAAKQVTAIKSMAKRLNVTPTYRVLPTMHDAGNSLSRDVLDELARRFGEHLVPITIRFDHRLREAVSFGQPVVEYATDSFGSEDYQALAQWLLDGGKGKTQSLTRATKPATSPVQVRGSSVAESIERPTTSPINSIGPSRGGTATLTAPTTTHAPVAIAPPPLPATGTLVMPPPLPMITEPKAATLSAEDIRARLLELTTRVTKLADRPKVAEPAVPTLVKAPQPDTGKPAIFGVKLTSAGALFVQPLSVGRSIAIAGDFNNWSATGLPMTKNEKLGVWERLVPVPPGRWQYRLVIDGTWTHDAFNPTNLTNPFGGLNSVLEIPAGGKRL